MMKTLSFQDGGNGGGGGGNPPGPPPRVGLLIAAILAGFALLSVLITLIAIPLSGILVRFRANYTPKRIRLESDADDEVVEPVSSPVKSYWGMLRRTKRIEGFSGLYKGTMPGILAGIVLSIVAGVTQATPPQTSRLYFAPTLQNILLSIIGVPFFVLVNRAIVTPRRLKWFGWSAGRRELLSAHENKRIARLYTLPGLVLTQALQTVYLFVGLGTAQTALTPFIRFRFEPVTKKFDWPKANEIEWLHAGLFALVIIASTLILTPLENIAIRLSLQRKEAPATPAIIVPADASGAPITPLITPIVIVQTAEEVERRDLLDTETVVEARSGENPYTGLFDCGMKMYKEEGLGALYRAWWATFIGVGLTGFVAGVRLQ